MGSALTRPSSPEFEMKDEDEYQPIKNFSGEIVGWRERTESEKLRRKNIVQKPVIDDSDSDSYYEDEPKFVPKRFGRSVTPLIMVENHDSSEEEKEEEKSEEEEEEEEEPPPRSVQVSAVRHRQRVIDKFKPSILPAVNFKKEEASAKLYKAIQNGNEEAITDILSSHTNKQRQAIAKYFKSQHKKTLVSEVEKELSGDFGELCLSLIKSPTERDADYVREIIENNYSVNELVGVLAWQSSSDLADIKKIYEVKFSSDIDLQLEKVNKKYRHIVEILLFEDREDEDTVTRNHWEKVEEDAKRLKRAIEDEMFPETLKEILCYRSWSALPDILDQFEAESGGKDLFYFAKKYMGKKEAETLKTLFFALDEPSAFYAEEIFSAVDGVGTNDTKLIHIFSQRSEVDLLSVDRVYKMMFGKKLSKVVRDETSGDYKKLLLAIITN